MAVNTKKVSGRRNLRYDSYQDLLNDAERLAVSELRMLGNWSLGQVLGHLARVMEMSIDGSDLKASWLVRLVARLFFRQRLLSGPIPPGFRVPRAAHDVLIPPPMSSQAGLAELRRAVERLRHETDRAPHPVLGELSLDEWDSLHLRHAEMHMSFLAPELAPAEATAAL
ncbi:MAG TPA: DUF1569 domain-containing protein [Pirellulales bacterium]|nr:DUF1569 domain-containing protein [Pirellulales bacterium]